MVIGIARVVLHVPASRSLKEKRAVVKSLVALTQNQFQMAVAEVDKQDQWQIAVLGLACVSTSAAHADEMVARAVGFIASRKVEAQVIDYETEVIHAF